MLRFTRFPFAGVRSAALSLSAGVAALSLSWAGVAWAQGTGRSLDIQPGARENAMGIAGVAFLGDPSDAMWWNPAALGFARMPSAQLTRAQLVPEIADDVFYYHAAVAVPLKGFGGIGLSYTDLSYGRSEGRDEQGVPTGSFGSFERSPAASVGVRVLPDLSLGATVKLISIQLAPSALGGTASTVGFDLAALYRAPFDPATLSLGLRVQNLGPDVTFVNEDQASPLSRNIKVGGAVTVPARLGDDFEAAASAVLDFNRSLVTTDFITLGAGVEGYAGLTHVVRLSLRGGAYSDPAGQISDWTWGWGGRIVGLTLDWAWIPQARNSGLGHVMKFTGGFHLDDLLALLSKGT